MAPDPGQAGVTVSHHRIRLDSDFTYEQDGYSTWTRLYCSSCGWTSPDMKPGTLLQDLLAEAELHG